MHITHLKEIVVFRNDDGQVSAQKGTTCDLIDDGGRQWVEKQWITGDWVFDADYEYRVEKHIYQQANARGLPVPELLDFNDAERKLWLAYLTGTRLDTPCREVGHLPAVLQFYDAFKEIAFPAALPLSRMDEARIYQYRLDQFQYIFPREEVWQRVIMLYEQCLRDIPYQTIPFDRILHNTLLCDGTLRFYDFEWTIAGPHDFTLARIAVEFTCCDEPQILSRVTRLDLYHLFLLRFYGFGREPESIYPYLRNHLRDDTLGELFDLVTREKYAGQCWLSP